MIRPLALALALTATAAAAGGDPTEAWWRGYAAASFVKTPDGRRLYVYCAGRGAPTVVLESGLSPGAWAWRFVQPAIARSTRVCSYDRAGYGRSDPASDSRDVEAIAADLGVVVKAVGRGAPVILVGHSLGGPITRQFAYRHPAEVAGLVLVDPSGDHQWDRIIAAAGAYRAVQEGSVADDRACIALAEKAPLVEGTADFDRCLGTIPTDIPADLRASQLAHRNSVGYLRAKLAEENALSDASGREADAARRSLGAMTLIVLSAGKPIEAPGLTADDAARITVVWRQMHAEMTTLSTRGQRRFVEGAAHNIPRDRPGAVVQAVQDVLIDLGAKKPKSLQASKPD
jgi:pimeloyl-ACP methyl ester carboxylesterase